MTAATATRSSSTASAVRGGWIDSPGWDLFWMFSALWGAALLLGSGLFVGVGIAATLVFLGNRFLSIAHSWSTSYMVLFSSLLAEERRTRPLKFVVTPAALAVLAFALGGLVAADPPYPRRGWHPGMAAWALYIGLFWIGHFWHFGNQDFGVLTIYRAKAGQTSTRERKIDKAFTVAMMFVIQPLVYLSIVKTTAFSELAHSLLPLDAALMDGAARVCLGAALLLTLGVVGYELSKPNRSLPKLLYYAVIFAHPVFLFGAVWAKEPTIAFLYIMSYLWSHWFIAVGLVSRINSRYYQSRGESPGRSLAHHALVLGGIAVFVWALTYAYTDYGLFQTDGFRYRRILAQIQPGQQLVIGLVLGFFLAEQLVHYYCDRCLFRFRDPAIRRKVGALLL